MPSDPSKPSQLSCTSCRHRKVKCDKAKPCSACRRSNIECIFPNRPFKPRGRQGGSKARNAEITQRLQRLEGLVGKLGGESAAGALINGVNTPVQTPPPLATHRQGSLRERQDSSSQSPRSQDIEQVSQADGSRYLGNDFWTSLSGEVGGLRQLLDAPSEDEDDEEQDPRYSQSPSASPFPDTLFIFGSKTNATDLRSMHPPPAGIEFLCATYFQNADPLLKILHRPTIQVAIFAAADNLVEGPPDPPLEALMFSIYFVAVTSLSQEQCFARLGHDKDKLLAQFKYGSETALANAQFLTSTKLECLQAFVLYVMCLRVHNENRTAWTLVSLAIRIGHSLDLPSEAAVSTHPQFEAELRRRLWFAITVLDIRSSEDRGAAPMIIKDTFDTEMPSNINDADLDPLGFTLPQEREGCTEMTFCLITHEASQFFRRASPTGSRSGLTDDAVSTMEQKRAVTREFQQRLESKYLVFCDESVPIFWVCKRVAKLIGLKSELLCEYPFQSSASLPEVPRDRQANLLRATEILELSHEAEHNPMTAHFRWFMKTYPQWHPMAVALAELCSQFEGPLVERAWNIIGIVFDVLGSRIADSKRGSLWRPIKKLLATARAAQSQHFDRQQQQSLSAAPTSFGDFASLNLADRVTEPRGAVPKQENNDFNFVLPDVLPNVNLDQSVDPMNWEGWEDFLMDANAWDSPTSGNDGAQWQTDLGMGSMFP